MCIWEGVLEEGGRGGERGRGRKSELGEVSDKGGFILMAFSLSFVISLRSWDEGDILRAISGD